MPDVATHDGGSTKGVDELQGSNILCGDTPYQTTFTVVRVIEGSVVRYKYVAYGCGTTCMQHFGIFFFHKSFM